ncbi:MAG: UPF0182 family protein [Acidimicrobiales bacterium]
MVASLVVLSVFARGIAGVYTDFLWFDSLGFVGVWGTILGTKILLAAAFGLVFLALALGNLAVADRFAPKVRPAGQEDEALRSILDLLESHRRLALVLVALVPAVVFGSSAAPMWNEWLLYRNGAGFGIDDPQFGRDVGFYIFELPFLSFIADWGFAALVVTALLSAGAHYVYGGLRLQAPQRFVSRPARAHLSILGAAIALAKAGNYYLDRFELVYSDRGVVRGAGYTDVNAQLPAITLLIAVSVTVAALLLYDGWRHSARLPVIAIGLWALIAVVVGVAYPAAIQRFRVEPAESARESEFIGRNIDATRAAMGLGDVEVLEFAYDENLTAADLESNAETIRNVRLWDPSVLQRTYQRLQEVRTFYRFNDVDVDRYMIDGELTQIVLSAREINPNSLPSETWENRHLAFTHGYGAVLSPANAVTSDGQPDFLVENIPPQGQPAIDQPRLYHGEGIGGYAIVQTSRDEIDYLRDDGTAVPTRYEGDSGVGIGSLHRRIAFALRFGDLNPVISGFITSESRILYLRDVQERAETVAPFLAFDHDPYPVVSDGRVTWILDAYLTSNRYPYASLADIGRLNPASGLNREFNYVRNSVKVAVDAYDGDVTLYLVDPDDPIATAYARAFPDLFTAQDELPDELRAHLRFPEDIFRVQTDAWGRYHIGDPDEFYSQSDRWNIAQDPGTGGGPAAAEIDPETGEIIERAEGRMDPYYLLTELPNEDRAEFIILQPFVPFSVDDSRRELSAFMIARSDPDNYGELKAFVMPRDLQVDGPAIVNARMNQQPEVSQLITLLSRAGSEVLLGNLVIVPIEQSLIYIRPLYVQATGASAVPELKQVIVAYGDRIAIAERLQDALVEVFGDAPDTLEESPDVGTVDPATPDASPDASPDLSSEARQLLSDAAAAFAEADAALLAGDPVLYATKIEEGRTAFNRALELTAEDLALELSADDQTPEPPSDDPSEE